MTQSPAGWYPDPYGTPQLRWWDGAQWTDATHPLEAVAAQGAQAGAGGLSASPGGGSTGTHPGRQTGPQATVTAPPGDQASSEPGPHTGPQTGPHTGPQPGPDFIPPDGGASSAASGGTASPTAATAQWAAPDASPADGGPWQAPATARPGDTARLPVPDLPPQQPPKQAGPMVPWIIGGVAAAVVIVLLVVGTIYLTGNRGTPAADDQGIASSPTTSAEPPPSLDPSPSPSPEASGFPQPSAGRITDPVSGLSYSYPGAPWQIVEPGQVNSGDPNAQQWTSGYQAVSQEDYERGKDWLGNVLAGPLAAAAPYDGPESMRDILATFLVNAEPSFYEPPHERRILADKAITVSGRPGRLLKFEMDFTEQSRINGWKWRTEVGALVIVDRGETEPPALLFATVPDNLNTRVVDQVIDSLRLE